MGLKIGERIHLVGIDENTPIFLQENNYKQHFHSCMRYLFYGTQIWCFCNTTKIPHIFIIMDMFQHFCDVFVTYYIIAIFIEKHLGLDYMVFCLENHIKSCVG
jgi:hypothetical protein